MVFLMYTLRRKGNNMNRSEIIQALKANTKTYYVNWPQEWKDVADSIDCEEFKWRTADKTWIQNYSPLNLYSNLPYQLKQSYKEKEMDIIQALKENKMAFGLMPVEMQEKAKEIGRKNFERYSNEWGDNGERLWVVYYSYRLRSDYKEPVSIKIFINGKEALISNETLASIRDAIK